jgi:hypothetical protein
MPVETRRLRSVKNATIKTPYQHRERANRLLRARSYGRIVPLPVAPCGLLAGQSMQQSLFSDR